MMQKLLFNINKMIMGTKKDDERVVKILSVEKMIRNDKNKSADNVGSSRSFKEYENENVKKVAGGYVFGLKIK